MKNLFTVILLSVGFAGFSQEVAIDSANAPVITFSEKLFEFGQINQGDVVELLLLEGCPFLLEPQYREACRQGHLATAAALARFVKPLIGLPSSV